MNNIPKITPIILAGGYGTRLWPLSRKSYPKQFSSLIGSTSLFQETAIRVQPSIDVEFRAPVIVTNDDFRFIVTEQLQSVGVDPGPVLIEPSAKNTAPAVLAAAPVEVLVDAEVQPIAGVICVDCNYPFALNANGLPDGGAEGRGQDRAAGELRRRLRAQSVLDGLGPA